MIITIDSITARHYDYTERMMGVVGHAGVYTTPLKEVRGRYRTRRPIVMHSERPFLVKIRCEEFGIQKMKYVYGRSSC